MRAVPIFVLAFLCHSGAAMENGGGPKADDGYIAAEVASVGIERESGTPVALLREQDGGRFIPISIGFAEARAIAWALAGVEMPRPMTHDLMASLLESAEFEVERIVVHSLRDHTYHASIEGRRRGQTELVEVDSRPSDAMALALRVQAPIFVSEDLLVAIPQFDFFPGEPDEQVLRVLGATVVRARPDEIAAAGLEPGSTALRVVAAGGASEAPLQVGDLILKADGVELVDPETLLNLIRGKERDDTVLLEVWREGEEIELEIPALPELRSHDRDPGTMA